MDQKTDKDYLIFVEVAIHSSTEMKFLENGDRASGRGAF